MVEVVEAMIGRDPASVEARASTSRLRSRTSGTPSKTTAAVGSALPASASGTTETRPAILSTHFSSNSPSRARLAKVLRTSLSTSAASRWKSGCARGLKSTTTTSWPA